MNKLRSGGVAITATSATPLHRDGQPVRLSSVIDRRARAASSAQGLRCVSMPTKRRRGGRHHCKAVKLAASVLARLAGEQAASDTFGIDRRTIRAYLSRFAPLQVAAPRIGTARQRRSVEKMVSRGWKPDPSAARG
jgi:hypothetical protein